ncbi:chromate transporter [Treponema sp.]|uniref:chromate transporter n=1 Tax=Treponema sp. TaxID=166 RepID=UPI00298D66D6|nr:chromate transporter [Treponema sp.]MCR5612169.1 chromate transporter [Treponema sp.]
MQNKNFKIFFSLFFTFFKIGLVTFGGGIAMLPILERELVLKRKWVGSDELMDYFVIGQSTPGIIAVNVATFCGHKLAGITGGVVATLGIVMPSVIIISVLSFLIDSVNNILWVKKALKGINAAVAANMTYAFINFSKKSLKNILSVIIMALAFGSIFIFNVPAFIIIFSSAVLGIIIFYINKKRASVAASSVEKEK